MAGTSPVGTWSLPNYTVDDATTYKNKIDADAAVTQRYADNFAPHPAASPAMSVVVDAGFVVAVLPNGQQTVTEHAQQTVTIGTAPSAPNNRIDLVVVDAGTGTATVVAGTPAGSPAAPTLPAGKFQVAQVSVPNTATSIGADNITDLRAAQIVGVPAVPWAVGGGTGDAITATYAPAITSLTDGLILGVRSPGANTTTTPTFAPNGLTAHTITKNGGSALAAGDIPANLAELLLRYNLANTRWELLNAGVSTAQVLAAIGYTPFNAAGGTISGAVAITGATNLSGAVDVYSTTYFHYAVTSDGYITAAGGLSVGNTGLVVTGSSTGSASGWFLYPTGVGAFSAGMTIGINASGLDMLALRYIAASDARLKSDKVPIDAETGMRWLQACPPMEYTKGGVREVGFLAQDFLAGGFNAPLSMVEDADMPETQEGATGPAGKAMHLQTGAAEPYLAAALRGAFEAIERATARIAALEDALGAERASKSAT